eukprot:13885442-Heterocapsa_arctica.AAC.1
MKRPNARAMTSWSTRSAPQQTSNTIPEATLTKGASRSGCRAASEVAQATTTPSGGRTTRCPALISLQVRIHFLAARRISTSE